MDSNQGVVWVCPVCGNRHSSDWRLSTHIGGMAVTYNDGHYTWATSREPDLDTSSPGTAASMLRSFVLAEVKPHELKSRPPQTALEQLIAKVSQSESDQPVSDSLISNLVDGYTLVASMEIRLFQFVHQKLRDEYGDEEWWTKGVPLKCRQHCSDICEGDDNRYDRWLYLNLMHLQGIIDKKWGQIFAAHAERLENFPGKKQFLKHFEYMNTLRNQIMHPLKGKTLGQDDFEFLQNFSKMLDQFVEQS